MCLPLQYRLSGGLDSDAEAEDLLAEDPGAGCLEVRSRCELSRAAFRGPDFRVPSPAVHDRGQRRGRRSGPILRPRDEGSRGIQLMTFDRGSRTSPDCRHQRPGGSDTGLTRV
jgi:hypothetical protein